MKTSEQKLTKTERIEYAAMMLAEHLADGPKAYDEVKAYCLERGISRFDLKAARIDLGVKTINTGATWLWHVPDEGDDNA